MVETSAWGQTPASRVSTPGGLEVPLIARSVSLAPAATSSDINMDDAKRYASAITWPVSFSIL